MNNSESPLVNLICLKKALNEIAPANVFHYENERSFILNKQKLILTGNLLQSEKESFRFRSIRELILELFHSGFLCCTGEDLQRIKSRYERLSELQSDPAIDHKTMKRIIQ